MDGTLGNQERGRPPAVLVSSLSGKEAEAGRIGRALFRAVSRRKRTALYVDLLPVDRKEDTLFGAGPVRGPDDVGLYFALRSRRGSVVTWIKDNLRTDLEGRRYLACFSSYRDFYRLLPEDMDRLIQEIRALFPDDRLIIHSPASYLYYCVELAEEEFDRMKSGQAGQIRPLPLFLLVSSDGERDFDRFSRALADFSDPAEGDSSLTGTVLIYPSRQSGGQLRFDFVKRSGWEMLETGYYGEKDIESVLRRLSYDSAIDSLATRLCGEYAGKGNRARKSMCMSTFFGPEEPDYSFTFPSPPASLYREGEKYPDHPLSLAEEPLRRTEDSFCKPKKEKEGGMSLLDLLTHFSRENLRKYRAEKKESVPAKDREKREGGLAYLYRLSSGERVSIDSGLFYLGRSAHVADYVVLNNPSISRMHAYILHDGGYYLVDNDSVNRSFLNGKMLSPYRRVALKTGDLIRLADEDFRFFLEEEK